jgi:hypothetical protein
LRKEVLEIPYISLLIARDSRIIPEALVKLVSPDIDRIDMTRSSIEENLGESSCGRAHIEASCSLDSHLIVILRYEESRIREYGFFVSLRMTRQGLEKSIEFSSTS